LTVVYIYNSVQHKEDISPERAAEITNWRFSLGNAIRLGFDSKPV